MAVTLIEKPDSRNFDSAVGRASGTWRYLATVTGEANPEAALLTAVAADAGFFWYDLARKSIKCSPLTSELYTVEVEWAYEAENAAMQDPTASPGATDGPGGTSPSGTPSGPTSATDRFGVNESRDMGGRPPKLFSSLDVLYSEKAGGGAAPDNAKLLNIDRKEGKVEGLEVDDPAGTYTFSAKVDFVTWGYIALLDAMLWHTNDATWRTAPPRTYCFTGYSLKTGEDGRVAMDFKFGIRNEETILANSLRADTGKELPASDVTKSGWDYLELDYEDVFDATAGIRVSRPLAMRVHQVLPMGDFETIGIGG